MEDVKRRKEKAKAFDREQYIHFTSLADLVLYAVFSLKEKGIETTLENVAVESYELFPEKFYLPGYPEYPDIRRPEREVRRLAGALSEGDKNVKYLIGNIKTDFQFTNAGLKKVMMIQEALDSSEAGKEVVSRISRDRRGKIERVLNKVQGHPLCAQYQKEGKKTKVSDHMFRDVLFATMETSDENLRAKAKLILSYCDDVGRTDVKVFIQYCISKYPEIFEEDMNA